MWFALLAVLFWLQTRNSPEYALAVAKFRRKVVDEKRAAREFRQ